jgi:hypothetical protein
MHPHPPDGASAPVSETPEALLDALREHPEWTARRRDELLDRLIEGFAPDRLIAAVRGRLRDLRGADSEAVLRIAEAYATPALLDELAAALAAQPNLAPERAWDALAVLDGAGLLGDYPELTDRWDELNEALDEDVTLAQLTEQLEGDRDAIALALDGLSAIEPEVRDAIVAGLARAPLGPGVLEFVRLLAFAHDPATRSAALDVLATHPASAPGLIAAWTSIADHHTDPEVVAFAQRRLAQERAQERGTGTSQTRGQSRFLHSLVTDLDGAGCGCIVISARQGPARVTAAFACDMSRGIREVRGWKIHEAAGTDDDFDWSGSDGALPSPGWAEAFGHEVVEDVPELSLGLLAGSLRLCGPDAPLAVRYWLEATVGPEFRPRPFPSPFPGWNPGLVAFEEMPERSRQVLEACPSWLDDSALTYELAEEIALRERGSAPDPRRDAGAYRYLFEHRLQGQLELYRRRLFWMALFWRAADAHELARSALALAWQLSDAQHVVPSHPFTVALATRSLTAAQERLRQGLGPRVP